jgi:hypothetical protein
MTVGTVLGVALGLVLGVPELGVACGLPLGVTLGAALSLRGSETTMTNGHVLLRAEGQGDGMSATFTASGAVHLAWEVAGRSPARLGPHAGFFLSREEDASTTASFPAQTHAASTTRVLLPGRYVITVFATPWTTWRVRVTAT